MLYNCIVFSFVFVTFIIKLINYLYHFFTQLTGTTLLYAGVED
ncbi:hypothetical protein MtrunA17_Chr4g0072621 [Medicago truncatula]|uniref:Transmembrane protein n=1 Tax=Medicago truncatula TaxID=3880 RepID=A0A396ILM4_MEDTR|nr:hypothetical protein MtrunA17_Chr4g0072621 [Medicago truncatula]